MESPVAALTIYTGECSKQKKPVSLTVFGSAIEEPGFVTSQRARPLRVKSSAELEEEMLAKIPNFKARPVNKKLQFCLCHKEAHHICHKEFHFATDERISRPNSVFDILDKLSLNSESCHEKPLPRNTAPNPFNLRTEVCIRRTTSLKPKTSRNEALKRRSSVMEITQKMIGDEKARVPKANPNPYTSDYPVVPPKPEPKNCTKPESFQLESLVRHEDEMPREMEERMGMEREGAQNRLFKAQPGSNSDSSESKKARKPLTEIQEFNLHIERRTVEGTDFDQKIKEMENQYKRYRDKSEAAKMVEEERFQKQMRKTMVPYA
ncbi:unnamed protein product, partial [Thlaspi arvense]